MRVASSRSSTATLTWSTPRMGIEWAIPSLALKVPAAPFTTEMRLLSARAGMAYSDEKSHGSAKYHGMKVGGQHSWTYLDGQWTERKIAPDRWEVTFSSLKRRNRKAPANSGAEVGSGYHWLIVAHQWVDKLDANTYATQMEGAKYLIAFKKPDWPVWNTQFRNSKRHAKEKTIAALEDMIRRIEAGGEEWEEAVDAAALVELATNFHQDRIRAESEEKTRAHPDRKAASRGGRV